MRLLPEFILAVPCLVLATYEFSNEFPAIIDSLFIFLVKDAAVSGPLRPLERDIGFVLDCCERTGLVSENIGGEPVREP